MSDLPVVDSLWDYRDPAGTEQRFAELLSGLDGTAPISYRAELLTQLARSRALQRRFADADRTLDEAEKLSGGERAAIRAVLERSRIRNDLRENERALALFHEAFDRAGAAGEDALALDAAHMLGYASPPEEALRWNDTAIETARASEDPALRRWLGTLHLNRAAKCLLLGRLDDALLSYAEAERARREAGNERGARDARAGLAKALRLGGRPEEALAVTEALLAQPGVDPEWNGDAHEEAAEALLALGRAEEAREQFARAWPILARDPWFPPTESDRLERIRRLAEGACSPQPPA